MELHGKEKRADLPLERLFVEYGDRTQTSYSLPFAVSCIFLVEG
jgi:hypothetical protein